MRIICLAENTAVSEAFGCEHGLSLWIETEGRRVLFDMGQTGLFAENAEKLGVDLAAADLAVLSHGHYDHGGGLGLFLVRNRTAPVYLNRYAFEPHYNGTEKYIGLDPALRASERLIFTEGTTEIGEGMILTDCRDKEKQYELGSFGLKMKESGVFLPDDFRHEQYLLIEEKGRRILFSGCSHRGVMDIVRWFRPHVMIGGFHFSKLPVGDALAEYAAVLDSYDTEYYTCHCTGAEQYAFMKERMGRLRYLAAGQTIDI